MSEKRKSMTTVISALLIASGFLLLYLTIDTHYFRGILRVDSITLKSIIFVSANLNLAIFLFCSAFVLAKNHKETKKIFLVTLTMVVLSLLVNFVYAEVANLTIWGLANGMAAVISLYAYYTYNKGYLAPSIPDLEEKTMSFMGLQPDSPKNMGSETQDAIIELQGTSVNKPDKDSPDFMQAMDSPPIPEENADPLDEYKNISDPMDELYDVEAKTSKSKKYAPFLAILLIGLLGFLFLDYKDFILNELKFFAERMGFLTKAPEPVKAPPLPAAPEQVAEIEEPPPPPPRKKKIQKKFANRVYSKRVLRKNVTHYEVAHAYLSKRNYKYAVHEFKKALKEPISKYNKMLAHYFLAMTYENNMRNLKKALTHWSALRKLPNHKVKYQMNLPYMARGEVKRLQYLIKKRRKR